MGGGNRTQTTTVNNEPPEFLRPFLKEGVEDLNEIRARGAPQFFPGSTVAPLSPETGEALAMQASRARAGSPATRAAQDSVAATARGDYLDPSTNPQFRAALDYAMQPALENFNEAIMPGLQNMYSAAGRYGSGSMDGAVDRAQRTLGREIAGQSARAGAEHFNNERARMLSAAALSPQLAQADYFDINQLGAAGSVRDAQAQAEIDASRERWNYDQTSDFNFVREYLAALNGAYPGGTSTSSYTPPRAPAFQSALQGGMTGASTGAAFGPWGALIGGVAGAGMGLLSR